jgi:hypothetical protein
MPEAHSGNAEGTVTHIAGNVIEIEGRVIQRCVVCGAKLCDSLNVAMPLNKDGSVPEFPTWAIWSLVQVDAGNPTRLSTVPTPKDEDNRNKLPKDSCLPFA